MIWTLSHKQGEFSFKNPIFKKCSFTYDIFFPAEYVDNRRKELNEMISRFYNENQAKFVNEHIKQSEKEEEKLFSK